MVQLTMIMFQTKYDINPDYTSQKSFTKIDALMDRGKIALINLTIWSEIQNRNIK